MNKQAYEHTVGLVLSKTAAPKVNWIDRTAQALHSFPLTKPFAAAGKWVSDQYADRQPNASVGLERVIDPNGDAVDAINRHIGTFDHPRGFGRINAWEKMRGIERNIGGYNQDKSNDIRRETSRRATGYYDALHGVRNLNIDGPSDVLYAQGTNNVTGGPVTALQYYYEKSPEEIRNQNNSKYHPAVVDVKRRHPNWVK